MMKAFLAASLRSVTCPANVSLNSLHEATAKTIEVLLMEGEPELSAKLTGRFCQTASRCCRLTDDGAER